MKPRSVPLTVVGLDISEAGGDSDLSSVIFLQMNYCAQVILNKRLPNGRACFAGSSTVPNLIGTQEIVESRCGALRQFRIKSGSIVVPGASSGPNETVSVLASRDRSWWPYPTTSIFLRIVCHSGRFELSVASKWL